MDTTTSKVSAEILALPLEMRAEMAFIAAVKKAIDEYGCSGMSLSIWRDGKVVEVSAEEMRKYFLKT